MTTEQTPKLDVKTLEYVLNYLEETYDQYTDDCVEAERKGDKQAFMLYRSKSKAIEFAAVHIEFLIHEQQEVK